MLKTIRTRELLAGIILLIAGIYFSTQLWIRCTRNFALDFAINWTATTGLTRGISLYDRDRLKSLGQSLIGPVMADTFSETFNSYIGLPTTAVFLLPFSVWTFPVSLAIYRLFGFIAFLLAVFFAGLCLPIDYRRFGWVLGLSALLISDAILTSLQLGQMDAWITLSLAISLWLANKDKWGLAGIGMGIAALLKISPVFLIVYCVLRRKFSTAITSSLTICAGLALAMLVGKPNDLWRFALEVLPSLSTASLSIQNQSLIAWLARIFLPENDFSKGIGAFQVLSLPLASILILSLWSKRRNKTLSSLELGLLIIISLLIGPITWDHYTSWAIIAVVYVADYELWINWQSKQRVGLFAILVMDLILLNIPTIYFSPSAIANQWGLRLATGTKTFGLLILLGVGAALLMQPATQQRVTADSLRWRSVNG